MGARGLVRFLLDSDALLQWMMRGRFARDVRRRIERAGAAVSAVSAYELTFKHERGRLRLPVSVSEAIERQAFRPLAITVEHTALAGRLPLHHRDPFDRMLIAQAQIESLTVVTRDGAFDAYDVDVVRF